MRAHVEAYVLNASWAENVVWMENTVWKSIKPEIWLWMLLLECLFAFKVCMALLEHQTLIRSEGKPRTIINGMLKSFITCDQLFWSKESYVDGTEAVCSSTKAFVNEMEANEVHNHLNVSEIIDGVLGYRHSWCIFCTIWATILTRRGYLKFRIGAIKNGEERPSPRKQVKRKMTDYSKYTQLLSLSFRNYRDAAMFLTTMSMLHRSAKSVLARFLVGAKEVEQNEYVSLFTLNFVKEAAEQYIRRSGTVVSVELFL